ncbi:MAG: hypothetical protein OJF49_004752 [Ktedonobacterales bacterium]|jgi:peptidoglycan/LPS O-acetylase OafA/YrhL|nr:MAG: hypothetical protein OJF49_004752 [Ktedonobacterales bacterium]
MSLIATRADAVRQPFRERLRRFYPMDNGPHEIRAMDGLRAIAALSVLVFHTASSLKTEVVVGPVNLSFVVSYLASGVHLFFILSGFLLFLPYARAMLAARPLPQARNFYRRRALRILPAYLVCLAAFTIIGLLFPTKPIDLADVLTHLALIHDDVPAYNRSIVGVFWTLAIEVQFYVLLPLIAWLMARLMSKSRSALRLIALVLGMLALALAIRQVVAFAVVNLSSLQHSPSGALLNIALLILNGSQGKYLEVFAAGMLCATLYVALKNTPRDLRWVGAALFCAGLVSAYLLAQANFAAPVKILDAFYLFLTPNDLLAIYGPGLIGLSYGAILLGVLWGGSLLRAPFETSALRFVGLISYSLYLWHSPLVIGMANLTASLHWGPQARYATNFAFAALIVIPFAYLLYQAIERPFLNRRYRSQMSALSTAA